MGGWVHGRAGERYGVAEKEGEKQRVRPPVCESMTCYTFTTDMGSFTSLL